MCKLGGIKTFTLRVDINGYKNFALTLPVYMNGHNFFSLTLKIRVKEQALGRQQAPQQTAYNPI